MIKIYPSTLSGVVNIPSSKSVAHRELIAGFLSGQPFTLRGNFTSSDITATVCCLEKMGGIFEIADDIKIALKGVKLINGGILNAQDSGSTLRFLLPVISALGLECDFIGCERLSKRPIGELLTVLTNKGACYSQDKLPLHCSGTLRGGDYEIDASISSQFITGLLFALPLLKEDSRIIYTKNLVSSSYVDITVECLNRHGISLQKVDNGFVIKGNQRYTPLSMEIEGDWSSACFMACLGAICGDVLLKGLNPHSCQGDRVIVELLKQMGVNVFYAQEGLRVQKGKIKPIQFDGENYPDIIPILSATLAFADGVSTIYGVDRLKMKESDRLAETISLLSSFGVKCEYSDNSLQIYGGEVKEGEYSSPNDHRMAMSFALLSAGGKGGILSGEECVKKSYANFFEQFKELGGVYEWI